jgi:hypothetical protein
MFHPAKGAFAMAAVLLATLICCERGGAEVVALYDFTESSGSVIHDRSGHGKPLDLEIANPGNVHWSKRGLEIRRPTLICSGLPASKIADAVGKSNELTIEAWLTPSRGDQSGPARIVTLSKNASERNLTLGQDSTHFDVRLRTTRTSGNGIPSLGSSKGTVTTKLTHVVYTRDRSGRALIFVNGRQRGQGKVAGEMRGWDRTYPLAIGNELSNDRPWLGTLRRIAIHDRALKASEVEGQFKVGGDLNGFATVVGRDRPPGEKLFETKIAPLIAEHCLECHDTATRKGKLDLSRKSTAFAGESIVPGKSSSSAVWESVESDEMPKKRPSLSPEDKALLKRWIDGGAQWTVEVIDPSVYAGRDAGGQVFVQRLTVPEYIATVKAAVGVDISGEAERLLPRDKRADGFSNTAYNLNVDLEHVSAFAQLAGKIVERLDVAAFCARFGKSRLLIDKDNRALIEKMGLWLLRGPLEEHELITYRGIATTVASASAGFDTAMGCVIEAMLQSPRFLYRVERQASGEFAGPFELASRLSYILWGAPPDKILFAAAEQGRLGSDEEIAAQVERMVKDPRAVQRSLQFVSEWLNLSRLKNLSPRRERFPAWSPGLAEDMREETVRYFEEVAWQRPMGELLNTRLIHANSRLARHYGLNAVDGEFRRLELPADSPRGGLLTQGSVLTIGGDEASMVSRGLFVLRDLLRSGVKDPPPCVNVTPVPTRSGLSQRGIAEERIANASCGGCHIKFEPLAFGLERFDGIGAHHQRDEHGNALRDDGEILFPGTAKAVAYGNSRELMDLLAGSDRVAECLTWKVTQFALGRPIAPSEVADLDRIHSRARASGGTYADVIRAVAMSDLVRRQQGDRAAE